MELAQRASAQRLALERPAAEGQLDARQAARTSERHEVAAELSRLLVASGLSREDFAARLGASASRRSTYLSAKVVPSATLLVRAKAIARRAGTTARGA